MKTVAKCPYCKPSPNALVIAADPESMGGIVFNPGAAKQEACPHLVSVEIHVTEWTNGHSKFRNDTLNWNHSAWMNQDCDTGEYMCEFFMNLVADEYLPRCNWSLIQGDNTETEFEDDEWEVEGSALFALDPEEFVAEVATIAPTYDREKSWDLMSKVRWLHDQ